VSDLLYLTMMMLTIYDCDKDGDICIGELHNMILVDVIIC